MIMLVVLICLLGPAIAIYGYITLTEADFTPAVNRYYETGFRVPTNVTGVIMCFLCPILSCMLLFFGCITYCVRQRYVTCIFFAIALTSGVMGSLTGYVLIRQDLWIDNLYDLACNTVIVDKKTGLQLAQEQYGHFVDLVMCSSHCPCLDTDFYLGKYDKLKPVTLANYSRGVVGQYGGDAKLVNLVTASSS